MNKINQVQDEEIDLFELLQTLWDAKRPISAFIVIAVLLGGSFLFFSNALYQSKMIYSVDTIPPFYSIEKVSADFKKKFYTKNIFKDWKKNNENTALVFEDFSLTNVVNGYVLSKDKDLQLAVLGERKGNPHIVVKSDQFSILDDFFMYAEYINKLLKVEYVNRAKDELTIIETRFKDFSTANDSVITQILNIDRFIVSAENGAKVLFIKRPTLPERTPSSSLILALSIILGGMIGVIYVLISNAICKRKDKLVKA
jgi:LPS O-antigen subunit length determinant protein (WzzB/FepE family)